MVQRTCLASTFPGDPMITAQYFDGTSTRLHTVFLVPHGDTLHIEGDGVARQVGVGSIRIGEPFERAPCILDFKDGSHCAVHQGNGRSALLAALGYRPSRVERLQGHWKSAIAAMAGIAATVLFSYVVLLPMLTERIAHRMPVDALASLGDELERKLMDQGVLRPSQLPDTHDAVEAAFQRIQPAIRSPLPLRVKMRWGPRLGANAMALPNGTLVLTDVMVLYAGGTWLKRDAPGAKFHFNKNTEERIAAVLAHEVAHLEQRHAMRKLVRGSLTLAASWALWGDFSGVASLGPTAFSQAKFSREMEAEADARAIEILKASGISPVRMAEVFEMIVKRDDETRALQDRPKRNHNLPDWMRTGLGYLATHPTPADRIARIRAAQ